MVDHSSALRVYVVEDSVIIRNLLFRAIESAGAELVGTSDNADEAIRELSRLDPQLIFLDLKLRSGTGFEVLKALQGGGFAREATKVVLTNYTEYREASSQLGANSFDTQHVPWSAFHPPTGPLITRP